jgi:hypothetical protein
MPRVPAIFISSTFYDLRQVRADIADFISQELGYVFLASEHATFPVDPTLTAIENCRRRVESDADVLILIVGARYGSVVPSTLKSITNSEYLAARAKGIPVFAFITKDVLTYLKMLDDNPELDLSGSVDSLRLFEFVRDVRSADGVWTFGFELAQDIVSTLRIQLAYQMSRGLDVLMKLHGAADFVRNLRGEPLRLVIEKPNGWVPMLFIELVAVEFDAARDARRDHELGVAIGTGEQLTEDSVAVWASNLCRETGRIIDAMVKLTNTSLSYALAAGAAEDIVYGARYIGRIYRQALEWSARVKRAHVPSRWQRAIAALGTMMNEFFAECDAFIPRMRKQVDDALNDPSDGPVMLQFTFKFTVPPMNEMYAELEKITAARS